MINLSQAEWIKRAPRVMAIAWALAGVMLFVVLTCLWLLLQATFNAGERYGLTQCQKPNTTTLYKQEWPKVN